MSAIKESNGLKLSSKEMTKNLLDLKLDEDENYRKIDEINSIRFSRRLHSTHITTRPKLFLEEKEDILMSLYKKQHKISNYSEQKDSISFSERQNVIQWCLKVLEPISLDENQKTSIFHRFCTAYDYIMEKYYLLNKPLKEQDEVKILIISIFLLTYKMEGFSLAKLTISSLIEVFLKEIKMDKNALVDKIASDEMKILEIMDYNPQIFDDNNKLQLSHILFDLFFKKYSLKLNPIEEKKIHGPLDFINKSVEFSDKKGLRACWGTDWPSSDHENFKPETVGLGIYIPQKYIKSEEPVNKDNYAFVVGTDDRHLSYKVIYCSDNETFGYHSADAWFEFLKQWKQNEVDN